MNTPKKKKKKHIDLRKRLTELQLSWGKGRRGGKRYGGTSQPIEDPSCKKIRRWRRRRGMMVVVVVDYIDLSEDR